MKYHVESNVEAKMSYVLEENRDTYCITDGTDHEEKAKRVADMLNASEEHALLPWPLPEDRGKCWCLHCVRDRKETIGNFAYEYSRMILCATCGNKRCPHATDHRLVCSNSNLPCQSGSSYE